MNHSKKSTTDVDNRGASYWRRARIGLLVFPLILSTAYFILPAPAHAALSSGLVGYWTFDGKDTNWGTNTTNDLSGQGNTGTLTSMSTTTSPVVGKIGQGLKFDGSNDKADITSVGDISTISYWINTSSNKLYATPFSGATYYKDGVASASLLGSELVTNGTFPSNITGWDVLAGSPPSSLAWVNGTSGDGSTGYARFTVASNGDWDRFHRADSIVAANTTYLISFWYRTSGITGNMGIAFTSSLNLMTSNTYNNKITPTTSWKYFSIVLTTSASSYPYMTIAKIGSIGSGTFDIDAISVKSLNASIGTGWHHIVTTSSNAIYATRFPIGFFQDFSTSGTLYVKGIIDDVRIYNRALSAGEVQQLYKLGAAKLAVSPVNSLKSGLVGYWTFDGKDTNWGTNKTNDLSGQGNTGTMTSMSTTTSPVVGKIGQGLKFNGVNDCVVLGTPSSLTNLGAVSVSAWIKPVSVANPNMTMVLKARDNNSNFEGWAFYPQNTSGLINSLNFMATFSTTQLFVESVANVIVNGQWQHVAVAWNGGTVASEIALYVNGIKVANNFGQNGVGTRADDVVRNAVIGGCAANSYFNGLIDDVRIYNRALSAGEVQQLYKTGAAKSR